MLAVAASCRTVGIIGVALCGMHERAIDHYRLHAGLLFVPVKMSSAHSVSQ